MSVHHTTNVCWALCAGLAIVAVAALALAYPAILLWWGGLSLLVTPVVLAVLAGGSR